MATRGTLGFIILAFVTAACGVFSDRIEVISAESYVGDVVTLGVASCNGAPAAALTELAPGEYEIEVRTTQGWERGNECLDLVEVTVAEGLERLTIEDVVGGEVFTFPPVIEAGLAEVDIDGQWQMVVVNGEEVGVGVNTAEIPLITIEAGFLDGQFGCNGGGAELLIDGANVRGLIESDGQLCTIPDGGDQMVLTERILTSMLESETGAIVNRTGSEMTWNDSDGNEIVFELAS